MSDPRSSPRRARGGAGGIAAVLALFLLAAGAALLWGAARQDDGGYLSTAREPFATDTYAMRSDNLDVDLDGAGWFLDQTGLGGVRIEVQPRTGKSAFVGVARTSDVSAYLRGTQHTTVRDVSYSPFRVAYRQTAGKGGPPNPADQRFWAASSQGAGTQTVRWNVRQGDWSVVVMNADASRNVQAGISVAAKAPRLGTAGWVSIGGGLVLLAISTVLLFPMRRRPRAGHEETDR